MKDVRPWHKRFHGDAIAGYMGLDLEERGAYSTLLDYLYDRRAPLPGNMRMLAGFLDCSVRKANIVVESLIQKGKLYRRQDGTISNKRFEKELEISTSKADHMAEIGSAGGNKSAEKRKKDKENKGPESSPLADTSTYSRSQKSEVTKKNKETSVGTAIAAPTTALVVLGEVDSAIEAFNSMVPSCPKWATSLGGDTHRKLVAARLKEVGLDDFRRALALAAGSHLGGPVPPKNEPFHGWRMDLAWFAGKSKFHKILGGGYGPRGHTRATGQDSARAGLMAFLNDGDKAND